MNIDLSALSFGQQGMKLHVETDFVAAIPGGISGRTALFDQLAQNLRFPAYFGRNWDALSDCLRDLSWLTPRRVAVLHEDVPQLPPNELAIYLAILAGCVRSWKPDEDHELMVCFPGAARDVLTRAAQGQPSAAL